MTIDCDHASGTLTVTGTLKIDQLQELRNQLLTGATPAAHSVLDLSGVDEFDAPALQLLLAAQPHFQIRSISAKVKEVAALLGFDLAIGSGSSES